MTDALGLVNRLCTAHISLTVHLVRLLYRLLTLFSSSNLENSGYVLATLGIASLIQTQATCRISLNMSFWNSCIQSDGPHKAENAVQNYLSLAAGPALHGPASPSMVSTSSQSRLPSPCFCITKLHALRIHREIMESCYTLLALCLCCLVDSAIYDTERQFMT